MKFKQFYGVDAKDMCFLRDMYCVEAEPKKLTVCDSSVLHCYKAE